MTESPIKIAVIDDNEAMTDLLVDLLDGLANFQVVGQAYDGKTGIDMILETYPEVVILDLCMPYIDGLGVMEALHEHPDSYFPKFVITTCVGQEHITAKAMKLGATYYMIKPFDLEYFKNRLNELAHELRSTDLGTVSHTDSAYDLSADSGKHLASKVSEVLQDIGVPAHTKGYAYLKDAIVLVHGDVKYMMKITKNLYPMVAEIHETTSSRVERAIRNSIELTLTQGDHDALVKVFGHRIKSSNTKLTNSEFIAIVAEKIKVGH